MRGEKKMRGCQTCIHSIPIFVTSNIYMSGYSQICCDCKSGRKDGYEPVYGEEPKKYIIELSENDYMALKEDGVQNHLALANTVIAHSVIYEERPQGSICHKMPPNYECDYKEGAIKTNFCPNCGAEMQKGGKEE